MLLPEHPCLTLSQGEGLGVQVWGLQVAYPIPMQPIHEAGTGMLSPIVWKQPELPVSETGQHSLGIQSNFPITLSAKPSSLNKMLPIFVTGEAS